jgi:rubredoxin
MFDASEEMAGSPLNEKAASLVCRMDGTMGRKLVWKNDCQRWTCSECDWVFEPSGLFADRALNKHFDFARCEEEFAAHLCTNYQKDAKA